MGILESADVQLSVGRFDFVAASASSSNADDPQRESSFLPDRKSTRATVPSLQCEKRPKLSLSRILSGLLPDSDFPKFISSCFIGAQEGVEFAIQLIEFIVSDWEQKIFVPTNIPTIFSAGSERFRFDLTPQRKKSPRGAQSDYREVFTPENSIPLPSSPNHCSIDMFAGRTEQNRSKNRR